MSRSGLDFSIMEIGLGGRLDAVNVLDADCTVITTVGLDHQEYLGDDRESIGREKAGIIRSKIPLVCGESQPPASVMDQASYLQAPVLRLGLDFDAVEDGRGIRFTKGETVFRIPRPQMVGRHQVHNQVTALAALLELVPVASSRYAQLVRGLKTVSVAGRLQQVSSHPRVYVDVGHNALAAEAIVETLCKINPPDTEIKCHCVIGMLADKDAVAVARTLEPVVSGWYCTGLEGERGQTGDELARQVRAATVNAKITSCVDVNAALDIALEELSRERRASGCILVFGSFSTAAQAINRWQPDQQAENTRY